MRRNYSFLVCLLIYFSAVCFQSTVHAGSDQQHSDMPYQLKTVFETDDVIWSFSFISDNELFVTLRSGTLLYVNLAENSQKKLPLPKVEVKGQGGLLDVLYHEIDGRNYVYLTYSTIHQSQLTTALARGEWVNGTLSKLETIFIAKTQGNSGRHFGSRLLIHNQHIYMTVGDRGERDLAQDLSFHNGKVLRLELDGTAVSDNPFVKKAGALAEIWTYGHRNPQGIDIEPLTGDIYTAEFGPRGGDELNLIKEGLNYGWPEITYGREYWGPKIGRTHNSEMEQPVTYWSPSISPSGMAFYHGDKIAQWKNNLFIASLGERHLRRLVLSETKVIEQESLFAGLSERIRCVRTGLDGNVYFSTDSGKIFKASLADD